MKYLTLAFLLILFAFGLSNAQPVSDLVVFSEDGFPFFVIMNGIQENKDAQTNVKVKGLTAPNYKVKIIFEDKTIPSIEKNVYTKPDIEVTYRIKKNNKGENVLNYYSEAPIQHEAILEEELPENNTNSDVVIHNDLVPDNSGGINMNISVDDGVNSGGVNVNMNINETEININADINKSDYLVETHDYVDDPGSDNVYRMPGYNGPIGCDWPMSAPDFQNAMKTIDHADFESDKLTIAKQVLNMNCLTVEQVKQIGMMFDFEDSKLEFAKFAYGRTYDIGNYFILNDMFEFSSSIDDLNNYINSHR